MLIENVGSEDSLTSIIFPEHNPGGQIVKSPRTPLSLEGRLQQKLKYWQERVGLTEWQVWIKLVEPGEFLHAHIDYDWYHYQATIAINNDHPEEHWDHTIVHELLHVLIGPLQTLLEDALTYIDTKEKIPLEAGIEPTIEPLINRLAQAIVGIPRPFLTLKDEK